MQMLRAILLVVACVSTVFAQKPATTIEKFVIHRAKEDDEDLSSEFPIVHTGNSASDAAINNFLQSKYLGGVLDAKRKASLVTGFDPHGDVFSYDSMITDRLVGIVIKKYHINNSMSLNGYDESLPFLFEIRSGQLLWPMALFSEEGALLFLGKTFHGFRESYNQTMDRYITGFSKMKSAAQKEQCDCDCEGVLRDVFRNSRVTFSFLKDRVDLAMDGCVWQNPGPHDTYSTSISMNDIRPWLSDLGKYLIDGGADARLQSPAWMLFHGTIGDNINTTFTLRKTGNELTGYEIYNRVGATIKLHGTVNGTQYTFDELTPEGKSVATFTATFDGNNFTGKWTNSDKTKTLTFGAGKY